MKLKRVVKTVLLPALAAAAALPLLLPLPPARGAAPGGAPFAAGRILVKFDPATSAAQRAEANRLRGGVPIHAIPAIGVEVVAVPEGAEEAGAAGYASDPHVIYAEPDYLAYAVGDPNDPYFVKQWGLDNDGQEYDGRTGTPDADVDAPKAWAITTGSPSVIIAILDSGIDQDHEDLAAKLVGNVDFTASSGWDDQYGHGTHVAGIAAAQTDNGLGVAGLGGQSSLLNVKVLGDSGWGPSSGVAEGIVWAADHGARVINMSLGYNQRSNALEDAVDYAWEHGVLLAAAAGNDGTTRRLYPAAYANCMAVAATDDDDQRVNEPDWWASSYGDWVDVAAPGLYVYSTFPNHPYAIGKSLSYDYGSGTSMATAFVAGLAGLLFGQDPSLTNAEVRAAIQDTADPIPGTGIYWVHGRINAYSAALLVGSPTAVTLASFTAAAVPGGVIVAWETASEVELLGFDLYRASGPAGELLRLNGALLPARRPGSPVGTEYQFLDRAVRPGVAHSYWLAWRGSAGGSIRYGPVNAAAGLYGQHLPLAVR